MSLCLLLTLVLVSTGAQEATKSYQNYPSNFNPYYTNTAYQVQQGFQPVIVYVPDNNQPSAQSVAAIVSEPVAEEPAPLSVQPTANVLSKGSPLFAGNLQPAGLYRKKRQSESTIQEKDYTGFNSNFNPYYTNTAYQNQFVQPNIVYIPDNTQPEQYIEAVFPEPFVEEPDPLSVQPAANALSTGTPVQGSPLFSGILQPSGLYRKKRQSESPIEEKDYTAYPSNFNPYFTNVAYQNQFQPSNVIVYIPSYGQTGVQQAAVSEVAEAGVSEQAGFSESIVGGIAESAGFSEGLSEGLQLGVAGDPQGSVVVGEEASLFAFIDWSMCCCYRVKACDDQCYGFGKNVSACCESNGWAFGRCTKHDNDYGAYCKPLMVPQCDSSCTDGETDIVQCCKGAGTINGRCIYNSQGKQVAGCQNADATGLAFYETDF